MATRDARPTVAAVADTAPGTGWTACRLCGSRLFFGTGDDLKSGLCRDHKDDPRAKHMRVVPPNGRSAPATPTAAAAARPARAFTVAEQALIKQLHGHLPAAELLRILNDRLQADVGDRLAPYTLEQLHTEVQRYAVPSASGGWTELRRQIACARREGVLTACTTQVVEDFCVAFQLAPGQAMALKDVIRHAREETS